jgi:hypothetical protein
MRTGVSIEDNGNPGGRVTYARLKIVNKIVAAELNPMNRAVTGTPLIFSAKENGLAIISIWVYKV